MKLNYNLDLVNQLELWNRLTDKEKEAYKTLYKSGNTNLFFNNGQKIYVEDILSISITIRYINLSKIRFKRNLKTKNPESFNRYKENLKKRASRLKFLD